MTQIQNKNKDLVCLTWRYYFTDGSHVDSNLTGRIISHDSLAEYYSDPSCSKLVLEIYSDKGYTSQGYMPRRQVVSLIAVQDERENIQSG